MQVSRGSIGPGPRGQLCHISTSWGGVLRTPRWPRPELVGCRGVWAQEVTGLGQVSA